MREIASFILLLLLLMNPAALLSQYGIRAGAVASLFYYPGDEPTPYNGYDVDLRPYLGYDAELVQTGSQKPLFSFTVSLYRNFSLSDRWGLRPELSFTQKGVNLSRSEYEKIVYKVKINYLEIPVAVTLAALKRENRQCDLYIGGYLAWRINAFKVVGSHDSPAEKTALEAVRDLDAGLYLGTDYKYRVGKHFLLLDLRLFIGLSNIFNEQANPTPIYLTTHKTKLTGLTLSLGYEL